MFGKEIDRREFIKKSVRAAAGAIAVPYFVPSSAFGKAGATAPSNRISLGLIGLGGMGTRWWGHLPVLLERKDVRVTAICDVKTDRREEIKNVIDTKYSSKDCRTDKDYREIIARDDIDAVLIATPEHWHGLMVVEAAKAGKDIYCEKPLTRTFAEGVVVREAVNKYGIVFQHGTQQRSDSRMVFGCELVRNGRIGKLKNVKIGIPGGARIASQPVEPVPAGFDYDMWLGPAPQKPYCSERCRGNWSSWYLISDYCIGHLSAWGVHHIDSAQQGCGTDYTGPVEIAGKGEFPRDGLYDTAVTWKIKYTFTDGVTWECTDTSQNKMGILFEGTDGWVFIWRGIVDAEPKSLLRESIGAEEINLYKSADHLGNFFDCVRSRGRTAAPVEVGHRSTTICCLGEIAMKLSRKLRWDPEKEQFVNDNEANRMLSRSYRSPWQL